jgi:sugar lactone lactonase YvrE
MTALSVRSLFRWLVVVLFLLTTLPGRAQDGFRYIGKFGDGQLLLPMSITEDPDTGKLYVSDMQYQKVFEYDANLTLLRKFGTTGSSDIGSFNSPFDLVVKNSRLYVADFQNNRIQVLDLTYGAVVDAWGTGNVYRNSPVVNPFAMVLLPSGQLAVGTESKVRIFSLTGVLDREIGDGVGNGNGQFSTTTGVAQDTDGNFYATDINNHRLQKFSVDGRWLENWSGGGTMVQPFGPYKVVVRSNRVFVTDHNNGHVKVYDRSGGFLYEITSPDGMKNPVGLCFDKQGRMFVGDIGNRCIHVFEPFWNDNIPPTSVATLTPAPDANGWTRGTTMNVTAADDASGNGVKEVRYQINDGAVAVVPGASVSVPFTSDGVFTVKTWAVDAANNVETPRTTTVKVDSTAPLSVAKIDKRTFSVSATDAVSGVASILVSIDGGTETVYSGPIALDINEHTLSYRSVDVAGNSETTRTVTLGGIRIAKLAATPSSVKGGVDVVVAAVLNAPAPVGGVSLTIQSSGAAIAVTSVVIPEGEMLALVSLSTTPVSADKSVVLSSSLGVSSASTTVTVLAEPLKLTVAPADIIGGANTLGTVRLLVAAPTGGTKVTLSSGSSAVTVPSSITVKAGKTTAVFTVRTKTVSATNIVNVTAKNGAWESVAILTLRTPELINLDIDPSEVGAGGTTAGTIHLSCPAPTGGVKVTLTSSSKNLVVPATVVVLQGEVSADFIVKALPVASPSAATVTASLNGVVKQTDVNIVMPRLKSLVFMPASATGGAQAKGTLSFNGIAATATTVAITSNNPALVPAQSVVISKGSSVSPVLLKTNGVGSSTTVAITATAGGVSVTADLILLPQAVASVKLDKSSVKGGASVVGTITLGTPAVADTTVRVSVSPLGVVTVPGTVLVAKGSKTATFTVLTNQTSVKRTVTISAESNGLSKIATLTVIP